MYHYQNSNLSGLSAAIYDANLSDYFGRVTNSNEFLEAVIVTKDFVSSLMPKFGDSKAYDPIKMKIAVKKAIGIVSAKAQADYKADPNAEVVVKVLDGNMSAVSSTIIVDVIEQWDASKTVPVFYAQMIAHYTVEEYTNPSVTDGTGNGSGTTPGGSGTPAPKPAPAKDNSMMYYAIGASALAVGTGVFLYKTKKGKKTSTKSKKRK